MKVIEASALQFAVVREDPRVEAELVRSSSARSVFVIASGGCTALALAAEFPELAITMLDPNPAQLAHVEEKRRLLLASAPRADFGVGAEAASSGLHERGNFERLFRSMRDFLDVFVLDAAERERRFRSHASWADVFEAPYWSLCFERSFADELLVTMFGPAAVQHAPRGSYAGYFRARFEHALCREDRSRNPFLHHVLLGYYLDEESCWPEFLRLLGDAPDARLGLHAMQAKLEDVQDFGAYDVMSFSNVFDWMDEEACGEIADRICRTAKPGSVVCWRQLNDPRALRKMFEPHFAFDDRRARDLLALDRSFFYDVIQVGLRAS